MSTNAVDGSGLGPDEHAQMIAERLALSKEQAGILVAELRNALVPAASWAAKSGGDARATNRALEGLERVLRLATAIGRRAR